MRRLKKKRRIKKMSRLKKKRRLKKMSRLRKRGDYACEWTTQVSGLRKWGDCASEWTAQTGRLRQEESGELLSGCGVEVPGGAGGPKGFEERGALEAAAFKRRGQPRGRQAADEIACEAQP